MKQLGLTGTLLACLISMSAQAEVPLPELYQLHCSACHSPDGSGDGRIVPSLRELGPLLDAPGGRDYLIRVPGVAQAPLESARLAALLGWVLTELSGVNNVEAFTEREVEMLRRRPFRDPVAARPPIPPSSP